VELINRKLARQLHVLMGDFNQLPAQRRLTRHAQIVLVLPVIIAMEEEPLTHVSPVLPTDIV
jgi:hypothetical protein